MDDMPVIEQSGILPYKTENGKLYVLLITTSSGKEWIIPKGNLEPGMSAAESAIKEAEEEAGVKGVITGDSIGRYRSRKKKTGLICNIGVFPMRVDEEMKKWHEKGKRKRRWYSVAKAMEKVSNEELRKLIATL
ncbi:MAG: NUDIX hydrolase [bacterium]|nr:NUDIX hydrolase [bacterium]